MSISKRFSDANFEYFHKESEIASTDESSEAYIRILGTKRQLCIRIRTNFRMFVPTSSIRKICGMSNTLVEEHAVFLYQSPTDESKLEQNDNPAPPKENISIPVNQGVPQQQPQIQQQPQLQQPSTIQPQMQIQQPQMYYQQPIQGQPQMQFVGNPAMNPYNAQQPMMQQQQFMNPNNTGNNVMVINNTNTTVGIPGGQTMPSTSGLKIVSIILMIIGFINILYFILVLLFGGVFAILNSTNVLNGIFCIIAGVLGLIKSNNPLKSSTPTVVLASIAIFITVVNMFFGLFLSVSVLLGYFWYTILLNLITIICEIVLIILAAKAKPQFVNQQKELFLEMKNGK